MDETQVVPENLILYLASQKNIRAAAAKVPVDLHGIVCNAGLSYPGPPRMTEDGIEKTFAVNHLGHFLLVNGYSPGLVPGTGLGKEESWFMRLAWHCIVPALSRMVQAIRRPEEVGAELAHLIEQVSNSGEQYDQGVVAESSPASRDEKLAAKLWRRSLEWTGLPPETNI
jgi:NAD(P)-dependent dehydrogenase (short-subunit alcohol dehydrogenase family)